MTDEAALRLLNKEDLIQLILATKNKTFINRCRLEAVSLYEKKLNAITDKQAQIEFKSIKDVARYDKLEKDYQKLEKVFNALCGL